MDRCSGRFCGQDGVSMIEMMVVFALISLLLTIGTVSYLTFFRDSERSLALAELATLWDEVAATAQARDLAPVQVVGESLPARNRESQWVFRWDADSGVVLLSEQQLLREPVVDGEALQARLCKALFVPGGATLPRGLAGPCGNMLPTVVERSQPSVFVSGGAPQVRPVLPDGNWLESATLGAGAAFTVLSGPDGAADQHCDALGLQQPSAPVAGLVACRGDGTTVELLVDAAVAATAPQPENTAALIGELLADVSEENSELVAAWDVSLSAEQLLAYSSVLMVDQNWDWDTAAGRFAAPLVVAPGADTAGPHL